MRGLKLDWSCRLAVVICSGGLWMSLEANMSMKPFFPCRAFSLAVLVVSTNLHMSCIKLPVYCVFRTYFFHDPFHVLFHDFNDHLKKGAKSALFPKKPTVQHVQPAMFLWICGAQEAVVLILLLAWQLWRLQHQEAAASLVAGVAGWIQVL